MLQLHTATRNFLEGGREKYSRKIDADRRAFWKGLFADPEFMAFAAQLRPLLQSQENKLMMAAPWGPHP